MNPRIQLDESRTETPVDRIPVASPPPATSRHLLDADWESSEGDPLMLYVAEEPRVGLEFSYNGLDWRIVEYSDGWIAKLLVD
jgi:hypothetical protein